MSPSISPPRPLTLARAVPARGLRQEDHLADIRRRLWDKPAGSSVRMLDYQVRITDGPNAYMQYKDVFVRGIYRFQSEKADPLVIDGGSNMGISILGFKQDHPEARVIGFEPDPELYESLQENVTRNGLRDVTLVNSGLAAEAGTTGFSADGSAGGQLAHTNAAEGGVVRVERLSDYLYQSVDFLKLNIEGQELPVLREAEASGRLRNVRRAVVEYHGFAGVAQQLGDLLNLLDRNGFRYLVHDFDAETCSVTKPPFRHRPRADWFCLVYAEQMG